MKTDFDYVIFGAGSAGCVLANRLSQSGKHSVLLVEAGGADKSMWIDMPLGIGKIWQDARISWQYWTNPESALTGQKVFWPRGAVLGGSSSINGMIFVRGEPRRYDEWAEAGNKGWGWKDLYPHFKRLEDAPADTQDPTRGRGGPMACSYGVYRDPISQRFIDAAQGVGIPFNPDYNGEKADGVGWLQFTIRNGKRHSTARGYLHPVTDRRNLTVLTHAPCEKVLFKGKRATGVRIRHDGMTHDIKARREVILSAGPIISPKILELSGVGQSELLKRHGIEVLRDLPGVGENLTDHLHTRFNYKVNKSVTLNDILNSKLRSVQAGIRYFTTGKGLLATSTVTAHAMTRSHDAAPYADLKLQIAMYSAKDRYLSKTGKPTDPFSGIGLGQFHIYPESRGAVHIISADPTVDPEMNANYFSAQGDAETALKGMRKLREIARHPAMAQHIVEESDPGFDIESDDEIIDFMKRTGQTSWHPVSSCRMGSGPLDVVDDRLRVHGLEGLRVIDSSIFPTMPATNTNIPTIATAEKGAVMVLEDAK
ncbi:GMC family oxidoreductase [Ruegeria marina]|uniref:Choline dehydrogenase n=1 Tax=Ruegeria marina TaxID=639004 RepID=A0A1G6VI14_9RHOB|nr:GMC family oxidoreductase N-terminal domain-containing protein [Ruegeria marina]SDD52476.1 choline dehydrogenase [Ruegeria marina]